MWHYTGKHRPEFAEIPQAGQESVWDYPRPPKIVHDNREIVVQVDGQEIARTTSGVRVLETASPPTVYLPRQDVAIDRLERASAGSFCEWKGRATYWTIRTGATVLPNAAWSYENPSNAFSAIVGYLSFYPALLECTIAGEIVRPQPGGFYGGWVTNEIVGPYKGTPGTTGW
ncbi:MAG TPA: hypothetical protein DDW52_24365 [Planctomycetaceae bacterium]|nr:hypothetical protein [Planctomycetaceae bacterium]